MLRELSVIIPTLNEEKYLPKLLQSISEQDFNGEIEVIVVDGHSEDRTITVAHQYGKKFPLKIVHSERNVGLQRNTGAKKARFNNLLFVDADVVLSKNLLNDLCERISTTGPFVCQVTHYSTERMNIADLFFLCLVHALLLLAWLARTPALNGDFILTNKETMEITKGFAVGAILGEDTQFGLDAYRGGARYIFAFRLHLYVSPRRVHRVGRTRLLVIWSKAFLRVRKTGAIFSNQGFEYPFGDYEK